MRKAKAGPRDMDPGRGYRELEGERKKKETKASEAAPTYPALGPDDWNKWFRELPNGKNIFSPSKGDLQEELMNQPEGLTTEEDNPGLKGLGSDYEINTVPQMPGKVLVRPKKSEPLTSEWEGPTRVA